MMVANQVRQKLRGGDGIALVLRITYSGAVGDQISRCLALGSRGSTDGDKSDVHISETLIAVKQCTYGWHQEAGGLVFVRA